MENVRLVLLTMTKLLEEKNNIIIAEAEHIKRSLHYVKDRLPTSNNRFEKDCGILVEGLDAFIKKLFKYTEQVKENIIKIKQHNTIAQTNQHLECLILLDCMQSRSLRFAEDLEYLHMSYKNLIDSYQHLYIPTPNINRRIKTSNLILYFNKMLNDKLEYFTKFFEVDSEAKKVKNIFSTWTFAGGDQLKDIETQTNSEYISFGFWFYEQHIFYPIAFHEIAHAVYKTSKANPYKLSKEKENEIAKQLLYRKSKSYLFSFNEEIIADIAAYSLSGESYIHALFYTGFFENMHEIFYDDLTEQSIENGEIIDDEEKMCQKRHENLKLLAWKVTNNFTQFFVRLKVLIAFHEEINDDKSSDRISGIKNILDFIYPEDDNGNISTLRDILATKEKNRKEYNFQRSFTLLLAKEFEKLILGQEKLIESVKKNLKKSSEDFKEVENLLYNKINEIDQIGETKGCCSLYDFSWRYRYEKYKNCLQGGDGKNIYSGRILRLYNLYDLKLVAIKGEDVNFKNCIWELTMYKFSSMAFLEKIPKSAYCTFGSYHLASLEKINTSENDKKLRKKSDIYYFTERHALFELKSYDGGGQENNSFSLVLFIDGIIHEDTDNEGVKEEFNKFCLEVENFKENYYKAQIFKSMGNEDFVVYYSGISFDEIQNIIKKTKESNFITRADSTILFKKDENLEFKNIVLLISRKNRENEQNFLDLMRDNEEMQEIYKLEGVFDYKVIIKEITSEKLREIIESLKDMVDDIQIEYQPPL